MKKELNCIVAVARNSIIGNNNKIPWHYKEDFKYFKEKTMGCPMIMGSKTFFSIGKPLPGRKSIVLTNDKQLKIEGCVVVNTKEDALKEAYREHDSPFVIGGEKVFDLFEQETTKIFLTQIDIDVDGDSKFNINVLDSSKWKQISKIKSSETKELTFLIFEKV